MSVFDRQPSNYNVLRNGNFQFAIKKLPNVSFFSQRANIPGIMLPSALEDTPLTTVKKAGDHIIWEELVIEFMIDENLTNLLEIFNWIQGLGFPEDSSQYRTLSEATFGLGTYSDASLLICNSNMIPKFEVYFSRVHPIALSSVELTTMDSDPQPLRAIATFDYDYYTIKALT